jgi:predicted DCC family thiol-disulfide oxidoreductase YuxK
MTWINREPLTWTGGQYSLFRGLLGTYLCVHFLMLVPWAGEVFSNVGVLPDASVSPLFGIFPNLFHVSDTPSFVTGVLIAAAGLSVALALGTQDRIAAVLLWWIWASLFGRNPLIANPSLPYVGLLLLLHAGTPRSPFGAWSMRGRLDPGGGWTLPRDLHRVAWILMSAGYTYSGLAKLASPSWRDGTALERVLNNPLARTNALREGLLQLPDSVLRFATWGALGFEVLFVVFALIARLRPLAWCAMLAMHIGIVFLIDFADLSFGMVLLHLFTFDPAWLRPRRGAEPDIVFFDGECGLCHRTVRWLLAEDVDGQGFRFAPLQGETIAVHLPAQRIAELPDSVVVLRPDGVLLDRSDAIVHILSGLGGLPAAMGRGLLLVPRPLRNLGYDAIARVRKRVFREPSGLCPMLPPELGSRFLA